MPVYPGAFLRAVPPLCPALGTLPLAVSAARGPPSGGQQGLFAPLTWPPLSGRQVLLFHASACGELTPPLHRAPPGQHTGHPLAEGTHQQARAFVPGVLRSPGFDAIVPPIDASAVVHARSSSRRPPDPLTAGLFPQRSPPRLLTGAACGGLGSPPALASPEGQTSITGTARFVPATFYIASLPFQDTPPNGGYARACYASGGGGASRVPRIAGDVTAGLCLVSCVLVGYAPCVERRPLLICSGAAKDLQWRGLLTW